MTEIILAILFFIVLTAAMYFTYRMNRYKRCAEFLLRNVIQHIKQEPLRSKIILNAKVSSCLDYREYLYLNGVKCDNCDIGGHYDVKRNDCKISTIDNTKGYTKIGNGEYVLNRFYDKTCVCFQIAMNEWNIEKDDVVYVEPLNKENMLIEKIKEELDALIGINNYFITNRKIKEENDIIYITTEFKTKKK